MLLQLCAPRSRVLQASIEMSHLLLERLDALLERFDLLSPSGKLTGDARDRVLLGTQLRLLIAQPCLHLTQPCFGPPLGHLRTDRMTVEKGDRSLPQVIHPRRIFQVSLPAP